MAAVTRYVVLETGRIFQINNVTGITISSPSVTDGTYRDSPPVIGGTGAFMESVSHAVATIVGGVTPAAAAFNASALTGVTLLSPSSVAEDDSYKHVAPRDLIAKVALLLFATSDELTTYDCFFKLAEVSGCFNAPPPGWIVTQSQ